MQKINNFKLGLFSLSALLLFIVAITCMGLFDSFMPKARIATIVNESVQGLSNGSSVRYKGVPIGTVTEILILTSCGKIQINFEVDLSRFRQRLSDGKDDGYIETQRQFYAYLLSRVNEGLTCRIEPDGITGSKYVEMDFFQGKKRLHESYQTCIRDDFFYIPSTPSMMSNLRMNALEILASIAAVDFKGISDQLSKLLSAANDTMQKAKLDELVAKANLVAGKLDTTVGSLNRTLNTNNMDKLLRDVNNAIVSIDTLSKGIQETITASSVPSAVTDVRNLTKSLEESNRALQQSLQKANDTFDAMTDLIRYLNENPSSMIRGRGKQSDPFRESSFRGKNKKY